MAQPLQSINLVAPAFKGINTEDSPLAQDTSFAEIADNAIIDRRGRLASRKGNAVVTTDKTVLGTDYLSNIHEFYDNAGNEVIFSTGNNKIMTAPPGNSPGRSADLAKSVADLVFPEDSQRSPYYLIIINYRTIKQHQ